VHHNFSVRIASCSICWVMRFCALSYFVSFYAPATKSPTKPNQSDPIGAEPSPLPFIPFRSDTIRSPILDSPRHSSIVEAIKDQFSCATVAADLNPIIARRFDANWNMHKEFAIIELQRPSCHTTRFFYRFCADHLTNLIAAWESLGWWLGVRWY